MGDLFSGIAMGFVAITAAWMNWRQMVLQKQLALTTSTALTILPKQYERAAHLRIRRTTLSGRSPCLVAYL
jgi:hypothetical protein